MDKFNPSVIKSLYKPDPASSKGQNGQVTIIGGSKLFHGAPLFALTAASRINDMVFFSSPEPSLGEVAFNLKSRLFSFIWVNWDGIGEYLEKSDANLIGPGLMRSEETREITREFLSKYPHKKWVIDAGSLQMMEKEWIPKNSILTTNAKEYAILFGGASPESVVNKYDCILVLKGPLTKVFCKGSTLVVSGGNPGLTKGGSGDVEAGLTVALAAKNDMFTSACAASYIVKKTADILFDQVGVNYNSDDLVSKIPEVMNNLK